MSIHNSPHFPIQAIIAMILYSPVCDLSRDWDPPEFPVLLSKFMFQVITFIELQRHETWSHMTISPAPPLDDLSFSRFFGRHIYMCSPLVLFHMTRSSLSRIAQHLCPLCFDFLVSLLHLYGLFRVFRRTKLPSCL